MSQTGPCHPFIAMIFKKKILCKICKSGITVVSNLLEWDKKRPENTVHGPIKHTVDQKLHPQDSSWRHITLIMYSIC